MKTQMHAMRHCQEHAKPTGDDIISTVKPCWQSEAWKRFQKVKITVRAPTSQTKISSFPVYTITLTPEFLKIFPLNNICILFHIALYFIIMKIVIRTQINLYFRSRVFISHIESMKAVKSSVY